LTETYQVIIAGAGPGGAVLARDLARAGISVAIFEADPEQTEGHNWSDAVEKNALEAAGFELPVLTDGRWEGPLVKTHELDDNLFEPHAVPHLEIRFPDLTGATRDPVEFRYITTDRVVLNRRLREQALEAGAKIFFGQRADGLLGNVAGPLEEIAVLGMRITDLAENSTRDVAADITVDATGYRSVLRTSLSGAQAINRVFAGGDLADVYRTVRRLDPEKAADDDLIDHYRYGAFTGYFWTHLHHTDTIDVGGGVRMAPDRVKPREVVEEMIAQRPSIGSEKLRGGGGTVLVGRSPYTLAASGFLAVGDAAGQVIPTTGCGVGGALVGAMLAAKTATAAIKLHDVSLGALWPYNRKWFTGPGRGDHFAALAGLKEILQSLTHAELAFLMRKDILSGEMLTPSINGIFEEPDLGATLKTLLRGFTRPGLLMQLNKATTMGKRIFRHYREYPQKWDPAAFNAWKQKARALFKALGA